MKLTSIFMLGACLQVSARVHSQTVNFTGRDVPLEKIFTVVEKQTGYVFFFDEAILKDARPVTIRAENYPLSLFLTCVLNDQPLKFSFQNKTIVISRKEMIAAPAAPAPVSDTGVRPAIQQIIRGFVTDTNGSPLEGASVTMKAMGKSTLTDGHGSFSLPVAGLGTKSKIVISYVGYNTREVSLDDTKGLYIQLSVAVNALDEEVVQAYGRTSQRLAVGNIVKVSGEEIQKQPVMNPLLALNGAVPGLLVTPTSGYASAPIKVEVRGRNTIDNGLVADPLYVIDGVPLVVLDLPGNSFMLSNYSNGSTGFIQAGLGSVTRGQSPLFSMNPADIESISVLKDAAATAIYGSRGANGAILITTKRGKAGNTRLDMQMQQSTSSAPRQWDMMNTRQYVQMRREAFTNDGIPVTIASAPDLMVWDTTRSTNWQKQLWGVAKNTEARMDLSGGDLRNSFKLGLDYTNAQDITISNSINQRVTFSSTVSHRSPDQKLTMDFRVLYTYSNIKSIATPALTTLPPNAPPIFDSKGALNYADWNAVGQEFPFSSLLTPSSSKTNFVNGSLHINYALAKGLNLGLNTGYNNAQTTSSLLSPIASQNPLFNPTGSANFGITTVNNLNIEPQLNYAFYIGDGKVDCMGGGTWQNSLTRGTTMAGFGYTNDALIQSIGSAPYQSSGENVALKKYVNVHGRINYNWLNKYILELVGNRDGSSNFGPGRQFGNFWSVGGAWIATQEDWLRRLLPKWWSFFKINANYGITGLDLGSNYQYLSQWRTPTDFVGYPLQNYNGVVPMLPIHAVNQLYQWQENRKTNIDLSLGFLKDRINLTVSYYRNQCNNQLTNVLTPAFTGFSSVVGNSPANVLNTGWEGMITARVVTTRDIGWTLGFNMAINRNKLVSYPNYPFSPYYTTLKIGQSLNTRNLLHYLGINPINGQRSYFDYNHDGVVTQNGNIAPGTANDDRYIALDPTPRFIGGITSQLTYKRFMLSLLFNFKKQMGPLPYTGLPGGFGNVPVSVAANHWQKPGDQALYPRYSTLSATSDNLFLGSDGYYTDASFIRLNNVAFTYQLPESVCKKIAMQGAALSINMENIFTITSYKGIDAETTFGGMPMPRIIAGRISFNF